MKAKATESAKSFLLQELLPAVRPGKSVALPRRRKQSRQPHGEYRRRAVSKSFYPGEKTRHKEPVGLDQTATGSPAERVVKQRGLKKGRGVSWTGVSVMSSIVILLILVAGPELIAAASQEPVWTAGRAAIHVKKDGTSQRRLTLKLSLRNQGSPGRASVQLLARWSRDGKLKQLDQKELQGLAQLGRFSREVALKRTAIIEVPLSPLRHRPSGNPKLELIIRTGSRITDHRLVPVR